MLGAAIEAPMIYSRTWAYCVSAAGVCATLWPALATAPQTQDSFPLSTYPMFAAHRGEAWVHQVIGVDVTGAAHVLPPKFLGTSEVLQAKVLIRRAAQGSKSRRLRLCRSVADRVEREGLPYRYVEIVTARFDPIDYLTISPEPVSRRRLLRCKVMAP